MSPDYLVKTKKETTMLSHKPHSTLMWSPFPERETSKFTHTDTLTQGGGGGGGGIVNKTQSKQITQAQVQ